KRPGFRRSGCGVLRGARASRGWFPRGSSGPPEDNAAATPARPPESARCLGLPPLKPSNGFAPRLGATIVGFEESGSLIGDRFCERFVRYRADVQKALDINEVARAPPPTNQMAPDRAREVQDHRILRGVEDRVLHDTSTQQRPGSSIERVRPDVDVMLRTLEHQEKGREA